MPNTKAGPQTEAKQTAYVSLKMSRFERDLLKQIQATDFMPSVAGVIRKMIRQEAERRGLIEATK